MSSSNSAQHIILRQLTYDVPEHQIVISFSSDEDAVDFDGWWSLAGFEAFGTWLDEGCPS